MSPLRSSRQFVPHAAQESLHGTVGVLRSAEQEHAVAKEATAVARHVWVRKLNKFIFNIGDLIPEYGNPIHETSQQFPSTPVLWILLGGRVLPDGRRLLHEHGRLRALQPQNDGSTLPSAPKAGLPN